MRAPAFWWRDASWAAALLGPLARLYGAVAARRLAQPGRAAGVPVVCVGGLTVGGSGKTPTALMVGRLLGDRQPVFLTRGYGGALAGPVTVDPARHSARDVGDEPLLLARVAPTVVARDRAAGAAAARAAGAGVIVMDDGFHNPAVAKDVSLVVVAADHGIGNGRVCPAGPLRAPLAAQLAKADALVVIGEGTAAAFAPGIAAVIAAAPALPVFRGRLAADAAALSALAGRPALAFAGIGHPDKFFVTLAAAGIAVAVRRPFPDHHRYTAAEAAALVAEAERANLTLLTTEKDLARLGHDDGGAALARHARALPVRLMLDEEERFARFVRGKLARS
ncbi:MAG TPA: tetraacyldisaccharide 4'-kinase [Xanthobacteraceae bacterium]|nr:tetraacyldisaccharide 4'-kinase [Xanthobacteraceae bacterium]